VEALRWRCDPTAFSFKSTDQLEDLNDAVCQDRAVDAIRFGISMGHSGYNIFALGPEGLNMRTTVRRFLEEEAEKQDAPPDWCYICNFKDQRKPIAFKLNAGRGEELQAAMARFVEDVRDSLRSSFDSDEYRTRRQVIEEKFKDQHEHTLQEIEKEAEKEDLALLRTPIGFAFAPTRDGKVIPAEVFNQFPESERARVEAKIDALQKKLREALEKVPLWVKEIRDEVRKLNDETAEYAVGHLIGLVRDRFSDCPDMNPFLDSIRQDVIENVEAIVSSEEGSGKQSLPENLLGEHHNFRLYNVNLLVNNAGVDHAPVIYEDDPSFDRLIGKIEQRAEMGALLTDFHMIRLGALHRANYGYLILDARKLLVKPMAWEGLKRALTAGEIRIESLYQSLGLLSTASLEPEPIPLDVKVVIIGDRLLYYLLSELDPEFSRLFKVAADFSERIERTDENTTLYARMIATLARKADLRPVDRGGVARALEVCARNAGDSERLSAKVEPLSDLLREADHWAGRNNRKRITKADVIAAEESRERRLSRVRERIQEEMRRGTIVIDTDGENTGQINGLSVLQLGDYAFGQPSRITARIWLGEGEVVDIEREVKLGGPLHSKGVLILGSFLTSRYSQGRPLSLGASLVFEQSYQGVEGDSASSAELYALLSEIAGAPIRQSLAVTGSVNQKGEVQAIGGVNEKIEGFFDLCDQRGLTGRQGVLIPETNVKHLMLGDRVLDAVKEKKFAIYPVRTIDQGIEILTGIPSGERGKNGQFPKDSFNGLVEARLHDLADKRRAFRLPMADKGAA